MSTPGDDATRAVERIDAACRRYEAEWVSGGQPRIEDFLARVVAADRAALARALESLDSELRVRTVNAPTEADGPARTLAFNQPTIDTTQGPSPAAPDDAGTDSLPKRIGRFEVLAL